MSRSPGQQKGKDAENGPETQSFLTAASEPIPQQSRYELPPGIHFIYHAFKLKSLGSLRFWQLYILAITYLLYVTYHLSRKPLSVVKNVLHRNCENITLPANFTGNRATWCSWEPFQENDYKDLYATLDFAYWMSYAIVMFFIGSIAERSNLRHFITVGMVSAGLWTIAFGMAYVWNIHALSYFILIQIVCGAVQATGWPVMVALVGNWFGKAKRGLIFGIWNSHSSFGNIFGSLIAAAFVEHSWAFSFIVPGLTIVFGGIFAFFFVILRPEDAGFPAQNVPEPVNGEAKNNEDEKEAIRMMEKTDSEAGILSESAQKVEAPQLAPEEDAVNFFSALKIPGVIEFALCLFFAKAVSYVFLVWLPSYIKHANAALGNAGSGYMSTIYDLGGITGGIIAGGVSDYTGARGITAFGLAVAAAPSLYLFMTYAASNLASMIVLLIACGITVVGPYALITTAVSADLGSSLKGKSKALATVTGIINGTGSFGSALGPLAVGFIARRYDWEAVFYCLIGAQVVAGLCLTRVVYREIKSWRLRRAAAASAP